MTAKQFALNGKTALVAGDSHFWSKYAAAALAEAGADVAVAAKNTKKVEEAVSDVQKLGSKAVAITADLSSGAGVQKMVDEAIAGLGKIDILVNATDLQVAIPFMELTESELGRVMDANFMTVFRTCQAVGKHMLQQNNGRIINVTSCYSERGIINGAAYCVSMGGVLQLTKTLSLEWALEGITVNAIAAGWFSETGEAKTDDEARLIRYIPSKRFGHPSEIGPVLVYLASDAADFTTGQLMAVDGGAMAHA